jgi:integrase
MEIIDNIHLLLGDNLKHTIKPGSKLKIAASCFSIYAFEALKKELGNIASVDIQALLGHESIATTQIYTHAGQERLSKLVADI